MKTLVFAALAAVASQANAECANACSGQGECSNKDQCVCYDNYFGSDCSQQRCPSALAFVDVPNGDLNHDGALGRGVAPMDYTTLSFGYSKVQWSRYLQAEYWPLTKATSADKADGGAYAAMSGEAHWYTECSGKGACDRSTGECACFDGYTGSACQRTTCPNDCSGRGLCRTVKDIAAVAYNKKFVDSAAGVNTFSGVQDAFEYRLYDGEKNSACVCDSGYGGVDCSLRECPRGDDPLTTVKAACAGKECLNEVQHFALSTTATDSVYYINFKDFNGNTWKTPSFKVAAGVAAASDVEGALEALPNSLVGEVKVSVDSSYTGIVRYLVTFTSISGNVPEFEVKRVSGVDAVIQPSEPVQIFDLKVAFAGTATKVFIDPMDKTSYRSSQLTRVPLLVIDYTTLESVFKVHAMTYELGPNPVSAIKAVAVDSFKYLIHFKNNPSRPGAAKNLGYNTVRLEYGAGNWLYGINQANDGVTEYSICSNRGMCDFSSGLCACFGGYFGAACDVQSALAQ